MINNASGGGTVSVYARTAPGATPSAFTLFLIEKQALSEPERFRPAPKIRTHGIRGADISGFECDRLPLPASAVIGAPGRGYEITLKTLQVSRTMCAALSLGAGDTALRAALEFALGRTIFNGVVANIPSAREQLVGAYADLLVCECLSAAAARALQCCPDRMAVWSSIVKYLVPTLVAESIDAAAIVLGARHYLRQGHYEGIFQKCLRDNAVVGLFDGSTAVNLHIVAGQLPALAGRRRSGEAAPDPARMAMLFDARHELAERFPQLADLKFTNNGYDEIAQGLVDAAAHAAFPGAVSPLVAQLASALAALDARVAALQEHDPRPDAPERAELARRYCLVHAGAACVLTWLHNRGTRDPFFDDAAWLAAGLRRVLQRLSAEDDATPAAVSDAVFHRMCEQLEHRRLFSLLPVALDRRAVPGAC